MTIGTVRNRSTPQDHAITVAPTMTALHFVIQSGVRCRRYWCASFHLRIIRSFTGSQEFSRKVQVARNP